MNYIKEINAFYDLMEREPLSASAVNLWHTLLHINNKAGWIEEFTVSSTILKLKGGLSDSSFKRARKELEERGFIEWRSRGRNLAPFYRMKSLCVEFNSAGKYRSRLVETEMNQQVDHIMDHRTDQQMNQQTNHQADQQVNRQTAPLIKQKETKQKETKQSRQEGTKTDAVAFYQDNFGLVTPFLTEELLSWINDFGDDFVIEAMKRALVRGKLNFSYVRGIMNSWIKQGIQSVEMLNAKEKECINRKNHRVGWSRGRSEEVVPDWFLERKRRQKVEKENLSNDENVDVGKLLQEYLYESVERPV
ncbi:DnaD domain protein [Ornithinibacillus sp. BX22]|uniref:DnaD domain protein n=1 Tax=Ornithinibacillus hominis TaxID=2763055 RepID=A0A923RKS5_9BACI|nr:DnaD domain protein [Ornithinibacillus hominis]MBC5638438.1 DnaD domain protein [Ornithinibacillus hominis]